VTTSQSAISIAQLRAKFAGQVIDWTSPLNATNPASELADCCRRGRTLNLDQTQGAGHGGLRRRPDPRHRNHPRPHQPVLSLARTLISHPTQGRQRS
jgi:hypothetical protein